ncbi:MAG: T9SS type A sorting domain-containing protein [Saprospiraceae bacterium]|nr:T9SS type A sorting domain-containing protein [Saprospiraceae bacterium]
MESDRARPDGQVMITALHANPGIAKLEVVDLVGRIWLTMPLGNPASFSMAEWPPGRYFLTLYDADTSTAFPSFSILESWNMNILHAFLLGIFLSVAQLLQAQYEHEWSVFTGIANYQGDLPEPHLELIESRMAGGLIYRFHWHHQWSLRGQIIAGQISGDDKHAKSGRNGSSDFQRLCWNRQ